MYQWECYSQAHILGPVVIERERESKLITSLKYFEISIPGTNQICRIEEKLNETTTFHKLIGNLTPKLEIY